MEHDEDEGDGGRKRREDLGSAGQRLTVAAVHQAMTTKAARDNTGGEKQGAIAKRIQNAMQMVQKLVQKDGPMAFSTVSDEMRATNFHRPFCASKTTAKAPVQPASQAGGNVQVVMYRKNWKVAYKAWRKRLMEAKDAQGDP